MRTWNRAWKFKCYLFCFFAFCPLPRPRAVITRRPYKGPLSLRAWCGRWWPCRPFLRSEFTGQRAWKHSPCKDVLLWHLLRVKTKYHRGMAWASMCTSAMEHRIICLRLPRLACIFLPPRRRRHRRRGRSSRESPGREVYKYGPRDWLIGRDLLLWWKKEKG